MYAVVEIKGFQYKVEKGTKLSVSKLDAKENSKVKFDKVLFIKDNDSIKLSQKDLKDSYVEAKVLSHIRDKKISVFKKKRRKGYQKRTGHRQYLTNIEIISMGANPPKKEAKPVADKKIKVESNAKEVDKTSKAKTSKDKK